MSLHSFFNSWIFGLQLTFCNFMIVDIYCVKSVLQKNTKYFIFKFSIMQPLAVICILKRIKLVPYEQLHIPINQNCKIKQDIYNKTTRICSAKLLIGLFRILARIIQPINDYISTNVYETIYKIWKKKGRKAQKSLKCTLTFPTYTCNPYAILNK